MAVFDNAIFNPQTYAGGQSGWLLQALRGGLLGLPNAAQTPTGPTYANGTQGMMGGVPFPIAPADNAALPPSAQPAGPATSQSPAMAGPQLPGQGGSELLQRLSAFTHNLGPNNGPIPRLFDALQGAATGQRLDPAGMAMQLKQLQANEMAKRGIPTDQIIASILDPKVGENLYAPQKLAPGEQLVSAVPGQGGAQGNGAGGSLAQNNSGMPTGHQLDVLADRFRATGEVPRVYGQLGALITSQIQTRAAQRASENQPILPEAKQLAANQAGFKGFEKSMSTLGTRLGNVTQAIEEISPLVDQVNKTYASVPNMGNFVPWNKIVQEGQVQFGNPQVAKFRASVLSLAQAYARMVSPSGQPHQMSIEHALQVLQEGYSKGQMAAAGSQLIQEANAIRQGNAQATKTLTDQYTGNQPAEPQQQPAPAAAAPTAINRATGQRIILQNGQWMPVK